MTDGFSCAATLALSGAATLALSCTTALLVVGVGVLGVMVTGAIVAGVVVTGGLAAGACWSGFRRILGAILFALVFSLSRAASSPVEATVVCMRGLGATETAGAVGVAATDFVGLSTALGGTGVAAGAEGAEAGAEDAGC